MDIIAQLEDRFGTHRVHKISNPLHPEQTLIRLYLELNVPLTVIMTHGLSEYKMPVTEKWIGREYNELCMCVPGYWDLEDTVNPNFSWVYAWLFRLESFVREKETWFGPGHTIPAGNPIAQISPLLKQEYFIFSDPLSLKEELKPIVDAEKTIHFLCVIPIFGDELDYKIGKGTFKFFKRFISRKNTEVIDDYRSSMLNSRMRFF
jgi:hypothetical protein